MRAYVLCYDDKVISGVKVSDDTVDLMGFVPEDDNSHSGLVFLDAKSASLQLSYLVSYGLRDLFIEEIILESGD